MKRAAIWIFWIVVAISGWRAVGGSVRDFEDQLVCTYQNSQGDCLTRAAYIKLIAHDAAEDAISELLSFCSGPMSRSDPRCALLKHD